VKKKIKNLFYNSNSQSIKYEKYFHVYEKIFKKFKNKKVKFVEIGIHNGGSLEIWKNFFPKGSKIIGIDINPECRQFSKKNIEVFIGNQSEPKFWDNFFSKIGKVDIVLDDGGHTNLDQIITASKVIKNIKDGGVLLVEDTHTSYSSIYNSSKNFSFIEFSKKVIDDINSKYSNKIKKFNFSLSNHVYSVEFYESMVVFNIDKKKTYYNKLLTNKKKNFGIQDKTWQGNEIHVFKIKNIFSKFKNLISLNKLLTFIKHKTNNKILKKYFE